MEDNLQKLLNSGSGPKPNPGGDGPAHPKLQWSEGGPVFESGPGWGFYVKKWLKKYLLKIILPVIIVVAIVGVLAASRSSENGGKITVSETIKIAVLRGDGRVLVARRALVDYLKISPQELTAGQKIFIEEMLRQGMENRKLIVGEEISFDFNDFREAILHSKNLSLYQLRVWEDYAKKAKLE